MTVRYERVVLQLEDRFTREALTAAAASKALGRSMEDAGGSGRRMSRDLDQSSSSLDSMSGRLGLLSRAVGALGPSVVPVVTASTTALAGMAAEAGAVVLAGGAVVFAFKGVGDALKAFNEAKLNPTAANLDKARAAMDALPQSARQAVRALSEMGPVVFQLKDAAASGFFPGFIDGLRDLETRAPQAERILHSIADAAGDLFAAGASDIAGPRWQEFFDFIERKAAPTLTEFGKSVGNVTHGLAEMIMAADPLSQDFGSGLLRASEAFDRWASSLSQTEGFREFLAYVEKTGPQVLDTIGSLADAILQIGEAAAPLGGPVLHAIDAFATAVAKIADSPIGPVIMAAVTAMSALSLATQGFERVAQSTFIAGGANGGGLRAGLRALTSDVSIVASTMMTAGANTERAAARMATARNSLLKKGAIGAGIAGAGALALGTGLDLKFTAMGAMAGSVLPGIGTAAGAAAGGMLDLASAIKSSENASKDFNKAIDSGELSKINDALTAKKQELSDFQSSWKAGFQNHLGFLGGDSQEGELKQQVAKGSAALAAALDKEAQSAGYASDAERRHSEALRATADATTEAYNAALGYEGALRNMRDSVKGVTGAFTKNGQVQHGLTKEQQDAASALLAAGHEWGNLTATQRRAAGGTRAARAEFVKTAIQLGMGKKAANELANSLFRIPPKTTAKVDVKTDDAASKIRTIQDLINALHGTTVPITVKGYTYNPQPHISPRGSADGGTVPSTGLPYADRHPYMLADGEEVISNRYGQADRNRSLLKAINAGHLADGGTAGGNKGVDELGKAAREAAKAMRDETKARLDALRQERDSIRTGVRDRFRSDIFAAPGNAWSGSGNDWRSRLNADIAQAKSLNKATHTLRGKGLDGAALGDLLQNADLGTITGFSHMSRSQLASYERLYNQRQRLTQSVGNAAGNAAYGKQIDKLQRSLHRIEKQLKHSPKQTGDAVGDRVNGGARNGTRRGGRR